MFSVTRTSADSQFYVAFMSEKETGVSYLSASLILVRILDVIMT